MNYKRILVKLHWISAMQFGSDPRKFFKSVYSLPRYFRDYFRFKKMYKGKVELMPCLYDWYEEGGATTSEYFWQDLLVARMIAEAKPEKHVDVGSRVDGFITHVASFREIEVFDIRPITTQIPGITFKQADLMNLGDSYGKNIYCDSLSCLHAIEHFGLGRYGDPLMVDGFENGFINMIKLLKPGGTFYLSTPIGRERVEFNANWVFDPLKIYKLAEIHSMRLQNMINIKQTGERRSFQPTESDLVALSNERYSLGIFHFIKNY
jgi:SAM-dependent methyltransferase